MASDILADTQIDENWKPNPVKGWAFWRVKVANALSLIALGCLVAGIAGVAFLYAYAWQEGFYPRPDARPVFGRGAWSYNEELGHGFMVLLIDIPVYTFFFGVLSLIFKPTRRAGMVLGCGVIYVIVMLSMVGLVVD